MATPHETFIAIILAIIGSGSTTTFSKKQQNFTKYGGAAAFLFSSCKSN